MCFQFVNLPKLSNLWGTSSPWKLSSVLGPGPEIDPPIMPWRRDLVQGSEGVNGVYAFAQVFSQFLSCLFAKWGTTNPYGPIISDFWSKGKQKRRGMQKYAEPFPRIFAFSTCTCPWVSLMDPSPEPLPCHTNHCRTRYSNCDNPAILQSLFWFTYFTYCRSQNSGRFVTANFQAHALGYFKFKILCLENEEFEIFKILKLRVSLNIVRIVWLLFWFSLWTLQALKGRALIAVKGHPLRER